MQVLIELFLDTFDCVVAILEVFDGLMLVASVEDVGVLLSL